MSQEPSEHANPVVPPKPPVFAGNLRVNANRLWTSLSVMAGIGPGRKGGSNRLALSDDDKVARDLLATWCEEAGCTVTVDTIGNMFARRAGTDDRLPPVLFGSHLDTQPFGGRYDGVLGVLAGLELMRCLDEANVRTRHPIELVNWTNEEGARFAPGMTGSAVFAGRLTEAATQTIRDSDGRYFAHELTRIGYRGKKRAEGGHKIKAYFELHIEQGPVLEKGGHDIGVVTRAQGVRWYDVTFTGIGGHAGTLPMAIRRDPMIAAARLIEKVQDIALSLAPQAVATVGDLDIMPGSRNAVPGTVTVKIDMRHPTTAGLGDMEFKLRTALQLMESELEVEISVTEVASIPPVVFSEEVIGKLRWAAERVRGRYRDIVSGALHDACNLSHVAPSGMIFIPSVGGISHDEAEAIKQEWATVGANVLLQAVVETADSTAG